MSNVDQNKVNDFIKNKVILNLSDQFKYAKPVLLTGAGFSVDAKNISGCNLPIGNEFAECF